MATRRHAHIQVVSETHHEPVIPSGVMGMLIFVVTEAMLFGGLISAFTIVRAGSPVWPPPNQPRLPFEETALNTLALLLSGVLLYVAARRFQKDRESARLPLLASMLAGAFFLMFQGYEWAAMLGQGLTLTSSTLGSFFYLIVGVHALHAIVALGLLASAWLRIERGWLAQTRLAAAEVFWYFVVAVWPVLWLVVYR
jgi:heme/copper-type cytochrome/quinol oxidase subunit 3